MTDVRRKLRKRVVVGVACALLIVPIVIALDHLTTSDKVVVRIEPEMETIIENLLVHYNVDTKTMRTRKVTGADKESVRLERRVFVPPEFNTLNFNHDLSEKLLEMGLTVVATEKSADKSVTMHIKRDDVIVESVVFVQKH
ncbi:MAG: hypothetical protein HY961_12385 [Ignavibacteriae bacterium]|nr:hypothetical protein [Ignavibacteriota bacterium]